MTAELFLSRFTPSMMSADVLEKVFVQRGDMADRVVDVLQQSILSPSKHHTLVIGSRGIGKTHLLSLIHNRIAQQDGLAEQVRIAWLREEEWGVASFLDFLYRILRALAVRYDNQELREQTEQLFSISLKTAERRAADLLREFTGTKPLLLIAENLDSIFAGLGKKGQQRLRAYLQEESSWTILASSQALFAGVTLYASPFYGFFDIHHLQELSVEDAARLVRNIAELANDTELATYVQSEAGRARIRAVHHLAGGNHRVYMILSEFLTRDSLDHLVEPFLRMMDDLTPYYQARMEALSPQQRKIIDLLCSVRGAAPVKEIAKRCFISSQTASSQLKDLRDRGYVESTPVGRDAYYELAEPLMRLALEVKNQRNSHVRLFLDFLRHWYARAELLDLLARTPAESVLEREYLQWVLAEEDVGAATPHLQALLQQVETLTAREEWDAALPITEQLVQERGSVSDWSLLGCCLTRLGRYAEGLAALDKALEEDNTYPSAWRDRAVSLFESGQILPALDAITTAVSLDQMNPYMHGLHASLLRRAGDHEQALSAYDRALELSPLLLRALIERGELLIAMDRFQEAAEVLTRAVESNPDSIHAKVSRGLALCGSGHPLKGIADFDEVLQSDRFHLQALQGRALALAALGNTATALEAAQMAHTIAPSNPLSNGLLGRELVELGKFEAALPFLDIAIAGNVELVIVRDARIRALAGLNQNVDAMSELGQVLKSESGEEDALWITDRLLRDILFYQTSSEIRSQKAGLMYETYRNNRMSPVLASGLVTTAEQLISPGTDLRRARDWLALWRCIAGSEEEFELAFRLVDTLLEYHRAKDPRILLELSSEERRIVETLLERAGHSLKEMNLTLNSTRIRARRSTRRRDK
jgi:tetratricopeptide (TPR) repeat protein/DNA-binding CsgD family transcriptional regulator